MTNQKLTQQDKEYIVKLKAEGYGSRYIAELLNVGKSTVNDFYKKYVNGVKPKQQEQQEKKPKLLLLDIETAPTISATFGRWNQNIGQDNVIYEGGWILTASYKWLGEDQTHVIANPLDIQVKSDERLCNVLGSLVEQADAVICHNAAFDMKVIDTRRLINQMLPLAKVKVIDTLVMARKKLRFNSNKLDSIAQVLGFGGKVKHQGIKLWLEVMQGCPEALNTMKEYNKRDVELLELVYNKLRQVGNVGSNFNAGLLYEDDSVHCPTCGSTELYPTGRTVSTLLSNFKELRCGSCGSLHRTRNSSTTKAQRKNLLAAL